MNNNLITLPRELDAIDIKALHQLDLDGRQHGNRIAKKLGLSRQVVEYRIRKLVERGYIRSFTSFIDPCKFGLTGWKVYLQLKGTKKKDEEEIVDFLNRSPQVWWVVKCFGSYDLLYGTLARDFHELNSFLYKFNEKFGNFIFKEDINNHLELIYFSRGYLTNAEPAQLCEPFMIKPENEKVDKVDIEIMRNLGRNARLTSTQIAKIIGSTPRVVNYRIKDLRERRIIVFNRLSINLSKFNLEFYKGLLYLSNTHEKNLRELVGYCRLNPYINGCVKSVGPWQFEIELEVPNFRQFGIIAQDMKARFPELINRIEPLLLYEERKAEFNFLDYGAYSSR